MAFVHWSDENFSVAMNHSWVLSKQNVPYRILLGMKLYYCIAWESPAFNIAYRNGGSFLKENPSFLFQPIFYQFSTYFQPRRLSQPPFKSFVKTFPRLFSHSYNLILYKNVQLSPTVQPFLLNIVRFQINNDNNNTDGELVRG